MRIIEIITDEGRFVPQDPPEDILVCGHCDWCGYCHPQVCILTRLDNAGQILRKVEPKKNEKL